MNNIVMNDIDAIVRFYESQDILSPDELKDNAYFATVCNHLVECLSILPDYKTLFSEDNDYKQKLMPLIQNYLIVYSDIVIPIYNSSLTLYYESKIRYLEKIPQPEQRTEEWYLFRNNRLTASDFYYVIDEYDKKHSKKNYKQSRRYKDMICKKCGVDIPFIRGDAINHGIKFEPLATKIYEKRNNISIIEFGCLPHPHIPFFGASPDGIVGYDSKNKEYIGRMLEIKCPKSRPINGIIPDTYYAQMQGQLEVCDLDYCDYLECDFKFYKTEEEFFENLDINAVCLEYSNIEFAVNKQKKECGAILEIYNTDTHKYIYHYAPSSLFNDIGVFKNWESKHVESVFLDGNTHLEYVGTRFWYLNKYNVILVKRDREWFNKNYIKINSFWEEVLKYREIGTETIQKKKRNEFKDPTLELKFID